MTKERLNEQIAEARSAAEAEIGFKVDDEFAESVLELCKRKCVCASKDEDYMPIMYRFELPMKVAGMAINRFSEMMQKCRKEEAEYVRHLRKNGLSLSVSQCS